jgi:hypothetical protein
LEDAHEKGQSNLPTGIGNFLAPVRYPRCDKRSGHEDRQKPHDAVSEGHEVNEGHDPHETSDNGPADTETLFAIALVPVGQGGDDASDHACVDAIPRGQAHEEITNHRSGHGPEGEISMHGICEGVWGNEAFLFGFSERRRRISPELKRDLGELLDGFPRPPALSVTTGISACRPLKTCSRKAATLSPTCTQAIPSPAEAVDAKAPTSPMVSNAVRQFVACADEKIFNFFNLPTNSIAASKFSSSHAAGCPPREELAAHFLDPAGKACKILLSSARSPWARRLSHCMKCANEETPTSAQIQPSWLRMIFG